MSQYDGAISTYVGRSAVLRYDLTNMRRKQYFCTDKTVAQLPAKSAAQDYFCGKLIVLLDGSDAGPDVAIG